MSDAPIRVLFVSTSNAARSILAEAVLRRAGGSRFEAQSAGTHPTAIDPLTERVLSEAGLDPSGLRSKSIDEVLDQPYDYVITLCDDARTICPVFAGADQSLHWGYPNPARATGSESERLAVYERIFTEVGERLQQFMLIAGRARSSSPAPAAPG